MKGIHRHSKRYETQATKKVSPSQPLKNIKPKNTMLTESLLRKERGIWECKDQALTCLIPPVTSHRLPLREARLLQIISSDLHIQTH